MSSYFAVALNDQGQFAATCVGDFVFVPEFGRHAWRGLVAETAGDLAEQVNGAIKSVLEFGDPFKTFEVVAVGELAGQRPKVESEIILEANRQLQQVIEQVTPEPRKLRREAAALV